MMHFLAGLPRSGSTLLGALLSQRPDTHVSATSNLISVMGAAAIAWKSGPQVQSGDAPLDKLYPMLHALAAAHYVDAPAAVIDKNRGWPTPQVMATMEKVQGSPPRIIATVRPIAECLASFMRVSKFDGAPKDFIKHSQLAAHLFDSYATLKAGFEAAPNNFLFIEYDDLVVDPQAACDHAADFLDLPRFVHALDGLVNPVPEKDSETWGLPGLHDIRATVERLHYSPKDVLGDKLWAFYQGGEFWNDRAEPEPTANILDLQVEAGLRGDFDRGRALCDLADPDDARAQFNRGWYLLREGKFREGYHALDMGREIGVFGNQGQSAMPRWDGRTLRGETILLNLEGGLGDQIHGARFARDIQARGGKVVVAGAPELASILIDCPGVSAFVESRAAGGVFHHLWTPSMSTPLPLGLSWETIDGSPYIAAPEIAKRPGRLRVGLRLAGNPKFEHEQHRKFDPSPLFDLDAELVSLQRDWEGDIPAHIETPSLATWDDTRAAIARLDLVITSCTSIAHLAGAMGKPTWIITPILSYYLWALPGDTTPWYKSVRLFRQTVYGDWADPMTRIAQALATGECDVAVG